MDLCSEVIVDLIRTNYVPVAAAPPTLTKLASEGTIDSLPEGQTSFHVVSGEGKQLLSDTSGIGGDNLVSLLKQGIRKFGNVTPREVKAAASLSPGWGVGASGGMARVGLFFRLVGHETEYRVWKIDLKHLRSMAPPRAEVGATYVIPETTCRQLLPVLGYIPPWVPNQTTKARLQAKIMSVTQDAIEVRLTGELAGQHNKDGPTAEGKFEALLTFSQDKEPRSLLLVNDGTCTVEWGPYQIQGLMEWRAASATPGK